MADEPQVLRGYGALQRGRWSQSGNNYFVTLCLQRPQRGLASRPLAEVIRARLHTMEDAGLWKIRTFVLMPDHVHIVFTLTADSDLGRVIRAFKGPLSVELRRAGVKWQPNFYDRWLRPDDELLPIFLYVFLNPYREELLDAGAKWEGYYCADEDWAWFGGLTNESTPFPEWLK